MQRPSSISLMFILQLTACSNWESAVSEPYSREESVANFALAESDERQVAASLLSITRGGELAEDDRLTREVICTAALSALDSILRESSLATQSELAAMREASDIFERRAQATAKAQDMSQRNVAEMVEQRQRAFELDRGELGSTALACAREGMESVNPVDVR